MPDRREGHAVDDLLDVPRLSREPRQDRLGTRGTFALGVAACLLMSVLLASSTALASLHAGRTPGGWGVRAVRNRSAQAAAAAGHATGTVMQMAVRDGCTLVAHRPYVALLPVTEPVTSPREELLRYVDHARTMRWAPPRFTQGAPHRLDTHLHQPVVFDPALDVLSCDVTTVTLHGDLSRARRGTRVVVELPDGQHLTPSGRLLGRAPRLLWCAPRHVVVEHLFADLRAEASAGDRLAEDRLRALTRARAARPEPEVAPAPAGAALPPCPGPSCRRHWLASCSPGQCRWRSRGSGRPGCREWSSHAAPASCSRCRCGRGWAVTRIRRSPARSAARRR